MKRPPPPQRRGPSEWWAVAALVLVVVVLAIPRSKEPVAAERPERVTRSSSRSEKHQSATNEPEPHPAQTIRMADLEIGARWLDGGIVTCEIPDVPPPNRVNVRHDADSLSPGFPRNMDPQREGDLFAFLAPAGSTHARLSVEAIGYWDLSWSALGVGEQAKCAALSERGQLESVSGHVESVGECFGLTVEGCGTSSEVDEDGAFLLLDAQVGQCDLRANTHERPQMRLAGPPEPVDVHGSVEGVVVSIDCDHATDRGSDSVSMCDTLTLAHLNMAMLLAGPHRSREQAIHVASPRVGKLGDELSTFCPHSAPLTNRIAAELDLE